MNYGWGKHMWNVSLADLMEFNKVSDPPPYMTIYSQVDINLTQSRPYSLTP